MTIYEYRPRQFDSTPDPAGFVPQGSGSYSVMVGGESALDTSDGYTSYTRVTATGGGGFGIPATYVRQVFRFEPVGASAPLGSVTRIWWGMDYQWDEKVYDPLAGNAANSVLMWCYFGGLYQLIFSAGSWGARSFGTIRTQELNPVFIPTYAAALIPGSFILGAGDPGFIDTTVVDVTLLRMFVEAGSPRLRQRLHGTPSARNRPELTRSLRARVYV